MKDALIFEWPGRHHLHLILPATVLLAAALHAGLFFVFSIIYPRPEATRLDPATVISIPPGSADAERLEAVLRSSDPAAFAPGRGLDLPELPPPVAYTPRYSSDRPALDPLPRAISAARKPFAGPVPQQKDAAKTAGGPAPAPPTALVSGDAIAARIPPLPEGVVFPVPQGFDPEPAAFLVALREDGQVTHVFQQHSSGDPALDHKAAGLLRSLKFSPDPAGGPAWGIVAFQWGADVRPMTPP